MSKPDREEELEYMKRADTCGPVAIQGHAGSFSEAAARAYFSPAIQLAPQPDFKALFASVEDGSCACGVVPIENSLMGSIHENYDLLLQSDVHIVGEIKLRIVHNLIVNRGVQLADIRYIASQPPALAQCTRFIHSLADAQTIATDDTAGAVKELAASGARDRGAIAGARAAAAYGMEILVPGIEDAPHNFTRFLVVNRCAASELVEPAKTTLVFALKHVPGALCRSLAAFADRGINLLKIESRPMPERPWEYVFYLDLEGHLEQAACAQAVEHFQETTEFVRILGSYQQGDTVGDL